jgi:cytochrome c-type biogenesis protein CcmH/NrfG
MARRCEEATDSALEVSRVAPGSFLPYRNLGLAYACQGHLGQAIQAYETALRLEGSGSLLLTGELAYALARAGRTDDARRLLTDLLGRRARNIYVSPYVVALIYSGVGDRAQALEWLNLAHRERDNLLPWMKVDPRLDPVRQEPAFTALMAKMKFD